MALLNTYAVTAGEDRGTKQWSIVVPVDELCVDPTNEISVRESTTDLAFTWQYTTRELYADNTPCRLMELTVEGSAAPTVVRVYDTGNPNTTPAQTLEFDADILRSLQNPGILKLKVAYKTGTIMPVAGMYNDPQNNEVFELVDLALPTSRYYFRNHSMRRTTLDHHMLLSGLELIVSTDLRAGETQLDTSICLSNAGIEESLSTSIEFTQIRWLLPPNLEYQPAEWDPAQDTDELVYRADSTEGTHIVGQQVIRPFYGSVVTVGATAMRPFGGQCSSDAFQQLQAGVGGSYVGDMTGVAGLSADIDTWYDDCKTAALAAEGFPSPIGGQDPVSKLWFTCDVRYGGKTSGEGIEPQEGALALQFAKEDHWEMHRLIATGYRNRQPTNITYDGWPLIVGDWLDGDGEQAWDMGNAWTFIQASGKPQGILRDSPFNFSLVEQVKPQSHSEYPWGKAGQEASYFTPIDGQHHIRAFKDNLALAWYANDPIAWWFTKMDAQLSMMHHNHITGKFNTRWGDPSGPSGTGMNKGRSFAWAGYLIAHANAFNEPIPADSQYDSWLQQLVSRISYHQMPMGLVSAQNTGKEATQSPFGDGKIADWFVYRATQQPKFALAMWAARNLRPAATCQQATIDPLLTSLLEGLYSYCWAQDTYNGGTIRTGIITKYVAGPNRTYTQNSNIKGLKPKPGTTPNHRFAVITAVPDPSPFTGGTIRLDDRDSNMISTVVGIADELGTTNALNMARKLCDDDGTWPAGTAADCTASMESWSAKPTSTGQPTGKPGTTWAGTLGYYQVNHP